MLVDSCDQIIYRMKWMFECRGGCCCELEMLQDCLKTVPGHVRMKTKWGTNIYVRCIVRPEHSTSWDALACSKEKRHAMNLKNSSHVRGVESVSFVASIMVVLKNSMGKK